MPYLSELHEWDLLQRLGALLIDKKAYCDELPETWDRAPNYSDRAYYEVMALETELRQVFLARESDTQLADHDLQPCWSQLRSVCSLLNNLVNIEFRASKDLHSNSSYPNLWELIYFLDGLEHEEAFDLVGGPNHTLFRYRPESRREDLKTITSFNKYMAQLFVNQFRPVVGSSRSVRSTPWKNTQFRSRASAVFHLLFERFTCEISHEVLLKVSEEIAEAGRLPELQLLLSSCSNSGSWQETLCSPVEDEKDIKELRDICLELKQFQGQGQELHLSIQEHQLFGVWAWQTMGKPPLKTLQKLSLDELITNGNFKPLSCHSLISRPSLIRYNVKEKRTLAVKLGFCLLDFFDSQLDSRRIHFLVPNDDRPNKDLLYLSFSSKLHDSDEFRDFRIGHPVLLSFAKLLIEIEEGDNLPLNIDSHYGEQNTQTWAKLFECVERMEVERNDSYIEAVVGCLNVHRQIAKSLRDEIAKGENIDMKIREELYQHIVRKLELSLVECTTRKRERSESPEPLPSKLSLGPASTRRNVLFDSDPDDQGKRRELWPSSKRSRTITIPKATNISTIVFRKTTTNSTDPGTLNKRDSFLSRGTKLFRNTGPFSEKISEQIATISSRPLSRDEFEVAIICALPLEYDAVSLLFDCFWDEDGGDPYGKAKGDLNTYTTGRMGNIDIVFVLLPEMGKASAAGAAASLRSSYTALKLVLLVGVCGGVPNPNGKGEMLLGDVIISRTIVQYDLGKQYPEGFRPKEGIEASLGRPTKGIRNMISRLETSRWRQTLEKRAKYFLEQIQTLAVERQPDHDYRYLGSHKDRLFRADYQHKHHLGTECPCSHTRTNVDSICASCHDSSCDELGCNDEYLVKRTRLERKKQLESENRPEEAQAPSIFIGRIGSGDTVYKSAEQRDIIANHYNILSLEMEGAGIWDELPCIVVKGVCDYADSHKNKIWQNFAAATAAATTKALLEQYIKTDSFF
ncbi:hypothetical protein A0O28_0108110 [Trichoderma guizhouense]|uniref:Uncharacterized protein n=1 Tax=Trichoderma guizhouense TaxID=1491466 RepID=A0A1T3CJ46_9HYPO|nr:hypothetical protein A0O28_0108110 [Trichoderma guizhouense]